MMTGSMLPEKLSDLVFFDVLHIHILHILSDLWELSREMFYYIRNPEASSV